MADNMIIGIIGLFVGISIMIGIGVTILGSVSIDCKTLDGYNPTTPSASTGWAGSCVNAANQTASAYSLLLVILIVVAAASILFVIKLL